MVSVWFYVFIVHGISVLSMCVAESVDSGSEVSSFGNKFEYEVTSVEGSANEPSGYYYARTASVQVEENAETEIDALAGKPMPPPKPDNLATLPRSVSVLSNN